MKPWGWLDGWGCVLVVGLTLGTLASIPALDGLLWRLTLRALPWIALAALLAAVVAGVVLLVKGMRR